MYLEGTSPRTWRVHTVCVYILKVYLSYFSFFLLSFIKVGDAWTRNDNGTKPFFGSGRSPKRTGPNTRPSRGEESIAGSDRQMFCAWSNTGTNRDLKTCSAVNQCPLNNAVFRLHRLLEKNPPPSHRRLSNYDATQLICSVAPLLLQHGCAVDTLCQALPRNGDGSDSGPLAHALDLLAESR
jgi:hypothetical protein